MSEGRVSLCPSGRPRPGAVLIGLRGGDGRVIYTPGMPPLDDELADLFARNGGSTRYRFAEPCAEGQCGHWGEDGCGVARAVIAADVTATDALPRCSIRASCRWFEQEGKPACHACPMVIRRSPEQIT